MENITLTHRKLQMNLFVAYAEGLTRFDKRFAKVGKGHFLTYSTEGERFTFELWQSATSPEKGDGERILKLDISKESGPMNDVRPMEVISHLREKAHEFLKLVEEYFDEERPAKFTHGAVNAEQKNV